MNKEELENEGINNEYTVYFIFKKERIPVFFNLH
jgi:hypothetical protein